MDNANENSISKVLSAAVSKLLKPLVRILLRNGISFGAFTDIVKRIYIDVAANDFAVEGRKQSVSRVSILTGLSRKEIARVQKLSQSDNQAIEERYNRAARVISAWVRDPRYLNKDKKPLQLVIDGEVPSFHELVKEYSGDVPTRAILDELIRVGAAEKIDDGKIRLLSRSYIPQTGELDKLGILGVDVAGLISTIDHNLQSDTTDLRFQRKVFYDNLPEEAMAELRELTYQQGQALIEKMDQWLSKHDRDLNPSIGGTGKRQAGIGIYYFE